MNWWKWWWQDYNELYTVSGGSGGYYGQSINTVIHRQVSVAEGEFVDHWGIWGGVHGNGGPFAGPGGVGASGVTGGPVATMGPIATGVYGITSAARLSRGPRGAAVGGAYSIPVTHTSDHTSVKPGSSSACSGFAPATKVWALGGRKPIGEIKVGDRVLAQDVETGELAYKPVLAVPIRPLGPRVKLGVYRESIIAASSHPFWSPGDGWRMAKDLAARDRVHTLSGGVQLDSVETAGRGEATTSLVVADFSTYFVGDQGILVHDNTPRQPTEAVLPGLVRR